MLCTSWDGAQGNPPALAMFRRLFRFIPCVYRKLRPRCQQGGYASCLYRDPGAEGRPESSPEARGSATCRASTTLFRTPGFSIDLFLDAQGVIPLRPVAFLDKHKVRLALTGHHHRNADQPVGATPTRCVTTSNAGWPLGDDPGWFRVLTIEGSKILSNLPLRYGDNAKQIPKVTLDFDGKNDGSATRNQATITNGFGVEFPACRVRFVMTPGTYTVTGGIVEQAIKGDKATVYDVRLPVAANSKATVTIRVK